MLGASPSSTPPTQQQAAGRPAYAPASYNVARPAPVRAQPPPPQGGRGRARGGAAEERSDDEKALDNCIALVAFMVAALIATRFLVMEYPDVEWGEKGVKMLRLVCEAIDGVLMAIVSHRL